MKIRISFTIHIGHIWKVSKVSIHTNTSFIVIENICDECTKIKTNYIDTVEKGFELYKFENDKITYFIGQKEIISK